MASKSLYRCVSLLVIAALLYWVVPSSGAPLNAGSAAKTPNAIDLVQRLEAWIPEHPEFVGRYFNYRFVSQCYEVLGSDRKATAVRLLYEAERAKSDNPDDKVWLLCEKANRCRADDPEQARNLIAEAERIVAALPEDERWAPANWLENYFINCGEYRRALDSLTAVNKNRFPSFVMFQYGATAAALRQKKAAEPLAEMRKIIRELQPEDPALRSLEEQDLETARVKALADAGLPDEAAFLFERYPRYERFTDKAVRIDTFSMNRIIDAYVREGRPALAIEFVKSHRSLLPDEQAREIAINVANAGGFDFALSLIEASGDVASAHELRALAVMAHRKGDFPRRDQLVGRCREAYRNTPPPDPKAPFFTDSERELAILDAVFGNYAELQRLIEERKGAESMDSLVCLLVVLLDKPFRQKYPGTTTWLDGDFLDLHFF